MGLRLVREPFDHPDYIFELKHDGFRAIAYLQNGECKLVSRNQRNLGFEALKRSLANLPVQNAINDDVLYGQFGQLFFFKELNRRLFRLREISLHSPFCIYAIARKPSCFSFKKR